MSWNTRQRNKYVFGALAILIFIISIPAYLFLKKEPTCSDNTRNQGEKGVDCGGPCELLCASQMSDINILWSRSFRVVDGVYNSVAYIENPNLDGGIRSVPYTFKLRDEKNIIVAERTGTAYVPPGEVVPVFEPSVETGERIPRRTTFTLRGDTRKWIKLPDYNNSLEIQNIKRNLDRRSPKIEAEVVNTAVERVSEVDVVAVVFNEEGNAIGASQTYIPNLSGGEKTSLVFTWPRSFEQNVTRVDIKALKPLRRE